MFICYLLAFNCEHLVFCFSFKLQLMRSLRLRPRDGQEAFDRMVSKGRNDLYKIQSKVHKLGVACRSDLKLGEFVCTYPGNLYTYSEWEENPSLKTANTSYAFKFRWRERWWVLDGSDKLGLGNFINHSRKDKNLKVKLVTINGKPILYFTVAVDCIEAGTELKYDYDKQENSPSWMART